MVEAKTVKLGFVLWLVCSIFYGTFVLQGQPVIFPAGAVVTLSDFATYSELVKRFWLLNVDNIYSAKAGMEMFSALAGQPIHYAMPLGTYITLTVLLFIPAMVSMLSYTAAQSMWVGAWWAISLLAAHLESLKRTRTEKILIGLVLLLIASSPSFLNGSILGQTSLAAAVSLYLLVVDSTLLRFPIMKILVFLVLSTKVHYGLAALLFCLQRRDWKNLSYFTAVIFIGTAIPTAWNGIAWVEGWVENLRIFSQLAPPAYYRGAFEFEKMITFQNAVQSIFTPATALAFGQGIILVSIVASLIACGVQGLSRRHPVWLGFVSVYFLFSRYLPAYEEVLLTVPLLIHLSQKEVLVFRGKELLMLLLLLLVLHAKPLLTPDTMLLFWFVKCTYCLVVFATLSTCKQPHKETLS